MDPYKIQLSEREELRLGKTRRNGRELIDLRVWTASRKEEQKWPTGKGFLIPPSRLPELRQAFADLETEARESLER